MAASEILIRPVTAHSPEIMVCARWRAGAFPDVLGASVDDECRRLNDFIARDDGLALIALCNGEPAGTCLLAPKEIEPCHDLTPWLAGLYVAPEFRKRGVGAALVHAIEDAARQRGHRSVYLYTDDAEPFYARLGWTVQERLDWHGFPMALMVRGV
jgi:predicted N-acetyltransferase YhbS